MKKTTIFLYIGISTLLSVAALASLLVFYQLTPFIIPAIILFVLPVNYLLGSRLSRKIKTETETTVNTMQSQHEQIESQLHELHEQNESISLIFENMQNGFIILDRFGAIITVNRSARELFGAGASYVGNNINKLVRNAGFLERVKAALAGHGGQVFLDEYEQMYQATFAPSTEQGVVILISDVSEGQLKEKLLREFPANVAHELSGSLAGINGFAEILGRGQVEASDLDHFAKMIKNESRRMISMVDSIMSLSKLDEADGRKVMIEFDLAQVARRVIEIMKPMAQEAQIELSLADIPCPIEGDRQLIYALFTELISNAIRFNRPKGWVKIAVSLRNRSAYINVTDTGIGIPREEQARVFERFYRASEFSGAGLGLAIAKQIVLYHGGTIDLESDINEGTRVFIKLPTSSVARPAFLRQDQTQNLQSV